MAKQQSVFSLEEFKKLQKTKKSSPDACNLRSVFAHPDGSVTLFVKPLSVNQVWKGKRFKTKIYSNYEATLKKALPDIKIPKNEYLEISYAFGFSSTLSDFDNPVKPMTDILQKRYGFNDRMIRKATITVWIVDKGCEFVKFKIESTNQ